MKKKIGFPATHITARAILQLVNESFDNNKFTLRIFKNLSKAFDTVVQNPYEKT